MIRAIPAALLVALHVAAFSQDDDAAKSLAFETAHIHHADVLELDTQRDPPRALYIEGDVDLELLGKTENENVRIRTPRIDFDYSETDGSLAGLRLKGPATIALQGRTIRADKASIDLVNEIAVFEGNVEIDLGRDEPLRTKKLTYRLSDGRIRIEEPGGTIPLRGL
jgi:hypothetical protein